MRRREFLAALGAGATAVAGCAGVRTESAMAPPLVEDRPDEPYLPTHVEGMDVVGTKDVGDYACALTYTYPHRFWTVTGDHVKQIDITPDDSVHLMPVVWHRATGTVTPDVAPQVTVTRGEETVVPTVSPWAMLSQPMGLHFGDNLQFPGEDTYDVAVTVGKPSSTRTGALAGAAGGTATFSFDFSQSTLEEIPYRDIPDDRQGTPGAVDPMAMEMLPSSQAPAPDDLPGTARGTTRAGDIVVAVSTLPAARMGGPEGATYVVVSPRTPYNRYPLTLTSLSATLARGSETVFEGALEPTLDADAGPHYGATVDGVESGDELTLSVDAPPQLARHEGYETAFFDVPDATLTL